MDFAGARLSRGSLVQQAQGWACPEDAVPVEVRSVHHWYREKGKVLVEIGAQGCLAQKSLRTVEGLQLVGIGPPPEGSVHASLLELGEFTRSRIGVPSCEGTNLPMVPEMAPVALSTLAHTRAADRHRISRVQAMGGSDQPYRVAGKTPIQIVSDWGYRSMPVVREFTPYDLKKEYGDEGLLTQSQREKATIAIGAKTDQGGVIYTRFLGSDARRSDRWGTPHTVKTLVRMAVGWYRHCTEDLPATVPSAGPNTCTLQFGDLAWYNARTPDPLGHTTHNQGTCVDIRLFRSDGSRYEAFWNRPDDRSGQASAYDQLLTGAFLRYANETVDIKRLFFNDPVLIQATPGLEARKGHDDHIHLCVRQPDG